jgi:hypothetical protein
VSKLNRRTLFGVAASVAASAVLPTEKRPLTLVSRPLVGPRPDWTRFVTVDDINVMRLDGTYDKEQEGTRVTMTLITRT